MLRTSVAIHRALGERAYPARMLAPSSVELRIVTAARGRTEAPFRPLGPLRRAPRGPMKWVLFAHALRCQSSSLSAENGVGIHRPPSHVPKPSRSADLDAVLHGLLERQSNRGVVQPENLHARRFRS